MSERENTPGEAVAAMFGLLSGAWIPHALHAAVVLGIADELDAPASADDVAVAVDGDRGGVGRLLRALTTIGVVIETSDGRFDLTPIGRLLRSDAAASVRQPVLLTCGPDALQAWAQLPDCVRTGRIASDLSDGVTDPFPSDETSGDAQAVFDRAMADASRPIAPGIAGAVDWTGVRTVVDVGGGYGVVLATVLAANPTLRGVDRERCRAGAVAEFAVAGVSARAGFVAADVFSDGLPAGDVVVMKSVLHDFDDNQARVILERCRAVMDRGARLLVVESLMPEGLEVSAAHQRVVWGDLRMLIATGGRERTLAGFQALLGNAGFRCKGVHSTGTGLQVIEATAS